MRTLAGLCAALLLSACVASGEALAPPQTVDQVDLSRYQGTWYELARLPMFFQRNCAQAEAHYALQGDGLEADRFVGGAVAGRRPAGADGHERAAHDASQAVSYVQCWAGQARLLGLSRVQLISRCLYGSTHGCPFVEWRE